MKKQITLLATLLLVAITLLNLNYSDKKSKKNSDVTNRDRVNLTSAANSSNNETKKNDQKNLVKNNLYETKLLEKKGAASLYSFRNTINACTNPPNDPRFLHQWSLNNIQNPDIDINICEAWEISQGQGVKVAVIDNGINFNQTDLIPNLFSNSYDTGNPPNPSAYLPGQTHGTAVAGVIGAVKNNGVQLAGVAPDSDIIGISSTLSNVDPGAHVELADGIDWAVSQGAQVINLSWGYDPGDPLDTTTFPLQYGGHVKTAIENAIASNVVVVVASGNDAIDVIVYPGHSSPNMLVVGSIKSTGVRANDSNYGPGLDVVAPGVDVPLLDRIDNGTSFAAPHVTGVVALLLSVKPNLTVTQVHDIINKTAYKLGAYSYDSNGWNDEVGHGLVNAHGALVELFEHYYSPTLISPRISLICVSNETFTLNDNTLRTRTWQVSPNLDIVSSSNSHATVKANSLASNIGSPGYVRVLLGSSIKDTLERKNFWVGVPDIGTPSQPMVQFSNDLGGTTHLCSSHNNNSYSFTEPTGSGITTHQFRLRRFPSMNVVYTSPIRTGNGGIINYTATPGWYVFEIRATNACGTSEWIGDEIEYIDCTVGGGGGGGENGERGNFGFDKKTENEFSIYPNPSSDILSIKRKQRNFKSPSLQTYTLYDLSARMIKKGALNNKGEINISNLRKGKYILKIYSDGKLETHHVMID